MKIAQHWVETLELTPHPEGGYFRETYRAAESISAAALPTRFSGDRNLCTSIYFLLEAGQASTFHRIKSDEIWYFHLGTPIRIHSIADDGSANSVLLGEEAFQTVVPAGVWFGAELAEASGYALVGCAVSPGFDFADFELARRDALIQDFPQHRALIKRLTHA